MADGPILVTGGTGTLGRPLVARLLADGAEVRVLSRRPRPADGGQKDAARPDWAVGDLGTGAGLAEAVAGAAAIVHCATNLRNDTAGTRRLIEAARASGARPHLVYISIVGIDRVPYPYYRAKLAAERLVEESELPWTVLRTTQFHDLVALMTLVQRWLPVALVPRGFRFQPIEVTEVADRLAELARDRPAGRVPDMAGPEVRDARDLARATLRAAGRRRPLVPLPLPGRAFRAFREGGHLAPERAVGTVTYEEYLTARARGGRL